MSHPDIAVAIPAPNHLSKMLHDNLVEAGQALRDDETPTFLLSVTDDAGKLIGACKGDIAFTSTHISQLWVDAAARGQGLGAALLIRAETLARARNCIRIHLETRNEKARELYEKLGYRVFGTLEPYAGDRAFHYLEKRLDGAD